LCGLESLKLAGDRVDAGLDEIEIDGLRPPM